jgi:HTH-type transcriptional regulator/antitoxin HigA
MAIANRAQIESSWASIAPLLFVPHTEAEYDHLVEILNGLIDIVREDESHPLASLMDVIGTLIERYEDEYVPELDEITVDRDDLALPLS